MAARATLRLDLAMVKRRAKLIKGKRKKGGRVRRVLKTAKKAVRAVRKKSERRTVKKIKPRRRRQVKKIRRKKPRRIKKAINKPSVKKNKTYVLNPEFEFFYELRDLVLKSPPAEKSKLIEKLNKLGRIKLAVISGIFINKDNQDPLVTDLLLVCDDIDRRKLTIFLKTTEADIGKEIKYAVMDREEFNYRLAMFDRFIRVLLEGSHEKLINKMGI